MTATRSTPRRRAGVPAAVALCLLAAGCGRHAPPLAPSSALMPRHQVVLFAPRNWACPVQTGASEGDLEDGKSRPLTGLDKPFPVTVLDTEDHGSWLALQVTNPDPEQAWLRVPRGQQVPCLFKSEKALDEALARVGKRVVFSPWKKSCRELHVSGKAVDSVLLGADAGLSVEVTGVELGPTTGTDRAKNKNGSALWLEMNHGLMGVRADLVDSCFSAAGSADATPPENATGLMHLDPGRCIQDAANPQHIECLSSLGVWSGTVDSSAMDVRLVHRTLGDVHFLDGHPVTGAPFARIVVSVTEDQPENDRQREIYRALGGVIRRSLARTAGDSVRLAPSSAPGVNFRVRVGVTNVRIGELRQSTQSGSSRYKIRDEQVPNPELPSARDAVRDARQRLDDARQQYQQDKQTYEKLKQQALRTCRQQANKVKDSNSRQWAQTSCNVADIASQFVQPSHSSVDSAQQDLDSARDRLSGMPRTITHHIMGSWTYQKKIYSRYISATLRITLEERGGGQPHTESHRLGYSWRDYEVQPDYEHNVDGHVPDRGPMQNPEALLPNIAARVSHVLAVRLKQAIQTASMNETKRAFRRAGNAPAKPGFEAVDALAFQTARHRLDKAALRGQSEVTRDQAAELPLATVPLGPGQCVLAVAVAKQASANLELITPDAGFADLRHRPVAAVEICSDEEPAAHPIDTLLLKSDAPAEVRWGLYRTKVSVQGDQK